MNNHTKYIETTKYICLITGLILVLTPNIWGLGMILLFIGLLLDIHMKNCWLCK